MKKLLCLALLACAATAAGAADVGLSINIGDPGYYGVISEPQPVVVYQEPVVVRHTTVVREEPLYLRVPPGHYKHWSKHCMEYGACDRQVYFVDEGWYETTYRERRGRHHGRR